MENKLRNVLEHCYDTVEYYKELFDELQFDFKSENLYDELDKLPGLKKEHIMRGGREKFLSNKYKIEDLFREYTSGSTGEPINLYKSASDRINMGKEMWKMRNRHGITVTDKMGKFHLLQYNEEKKLESMPINYGANHISFSLLHLCDQEIELYYQALIKQNVTWIFGAPSAIFRLADYMLRKGYSPIESIKYIELSGEYRTDEMKKIIQKAFSCTVVDFYGTREVQGIAHSCEYEQLHCFDDNVYVEILDSEGKRLQDGEVGHIHVTSLNGYAMPLLRYDTGDCGSIHRNVQCKCGMCGNIIKLENTRAVEYIRCEDGKQLNSGVLYCALLEMNRDYDGMIVQFQITQKGFKDFHLKLSLGKKYMEVHEIVELFKRTAKKFGMYEAEWSYEVVDHIEISDRTGKTKYFIREDF